MNLTIREFENSIISLCNRSPLPVEVKRLVLADVHRKMEGEADKVADAELAQKMLNNLAQKNDEVNCDDTAQEESKSDSRKSTGEN